MQVGINELRPYLQDFDFPSLFVEGLGWNHYEAAPVMVEVDGFGYALRPVAEKAGFVVFTCAPGPDGAVPPYPVRRKIEVQAAKSAFEHLVIFVDDEQTTQVWQWVKRENGKPTACREQQFHAGQSGESLLQRLQAIAFDLEDEARGLGIAEVSSRVRGTFDVEKVTKRFYEQFRKELTAFSDFIEGITARVDRDWYASLMLNRMMFVYFIQKQRFLDGDPDYLRRKLQAVQALPAAPEPAAGNAPMHGSLVPDLLAGYAVPPEANSGRAEPAEGSSDPQSAPAEPAHGSPDPHSARAEPDSQSVRAEPVEARGGRRFHRFYRLFLLRLFHEGLGQPEAQRAPELTALLGRVPFLNGGLFDVHDLERDNPGIAIPDAAFERVFAFFDAYRWHLDERPHREDNEINPDVLGYIFEKYVNQKQMGAYYTKEDITGYIARNTVVPFLFDAAKRECPVAFGEDGGVWRMLRDDPDRYIYPAVGHGITWNARDAQNPTRLESSASPTANKGSPTSAPNSTPSPSEGEGRGEGDNDRGFAYALPQEIAAGIHDVAKRGDWNQPAPDDYALPTETWREVIARRQRHAEVRGKLAAGEVTGVNDLITLNLDVERFARDVIAQSEGPELLRAFWHALYGNRERTHTGISVLDPTCGSGAFLFAALNVLEPLYTACLEGMRGFLDDAERSERKRSPEHLRDFRRILAQVEKHPSQRYFILKSIVLNNLYGVDIMEEAVEICKLRLFLKLVAQLERYDQIEPLPDVDFNVRAGNTLVGFTSLDAVRQAMTITPDGQRRAMFDEDRAALARIEEEAEIASAAFNQFRRQQTTLGGEVTAAAKQALRDRLQRLDDELDRLLAAEYGIAPHKPTAYTPWRASHQPFHWFTEFYGIMSKGGFDVVIGNPPYVEYSKVKSDYSVRGLETEVCGNLYAMTWERSLNLATNGHLGMIVPASAVCTDGYASLRKLLMDAGNVVVSSYSDNPGRLFDGMPHNRLQIILVDKGARPRRSFATVYNKWRTDARQYLFHDLAFIDSTRVSNDAGIAKIGHALEASILRKVSRFPVVPQQSRTSSQQHSLWYTRKLSHFLQILNFIPAIYDTKGKLRKPSELKEVCFESALIRDGALGILNTSLFSWMVQCFSDCRNLNQREVRMIRFDTADTGRLERLSIIAHELMEDMKAKSELKKQGKLTIQQTFPRQSKAIIDKLDKVLAEHYGITDEELDFIINYDIKYRMGRTNIN